MRFNGPAPETINGRLAMVGFVAGAMREVNTGEPLAQQVAAAGPGTWLLAAVIVYASLVPILKAAKFEAFGAYFAFAMQRSLVVIKCPSVVMVRPIIAS